MANGLMGLSDLLGQSSNATAGGLMSGAGIFSNPPTRGQQRSRLLTDLISNAGQDPYARLGSAFGGLIGMGARAGAEGLGIVDEPEEVRRNNAIREVQQLVSQEGLDPLDPGFGERVAELFTERNFPDLATRSLLQARQLQSQFAPEPVERETVIRGGTPEGEIAGLAENESAIATIRNGQIVGLENRTAEDRTVDAPSIIREYNLAKEQGLIPETTSFTEYRTQTVEGTGPQIGTIPAGFQLTRDGDSFRLEPIPGSNAEAEREQAEVQEEQRGELAGRAAGVVFEDINRLEELVENDSLLNPVLGLKGVVASQIPGTSRVDADGLAQTIRANIGFDRLQQMREASPTGGALGQVSNQELETLQTVLGNLSLSQSQEQILLNLSRLKDIYAQILPKAAAYPNAEDFGFAEVPEDITQPLGNGDSNGQTQRLRYNIETGEFE